MSLLGRIIILLDVDIKDDNIAMVFLFPYIEVHICLGLVFNPSFVAAYLLPYRIFSSFIPAICICFLSYENVSFLVLIAYSDPS